jgi:hypothetical protein
VTQMKQIVNMVVSVSAAVALAAFGVVTSPPANAKGPWAVITWSPPEQVSGTGVGATDQEATSASMASCKSNGGTACQFGGNATSGMCVALAVDPNDPTKFGGSIAPTLDEARSGAVSIVPGRVLKQAMCAGPIPPDQNAPPPDQKAPPAAPTGADRDGDGLSDRDEISRLTNIFLPDTDLDGVNDGDEVKNGTNPLVIFDN